MRFLADENFPRAAVVALRDRGNDIIWVAEVMPGSSDADVLARFEQEQRTLLTFDKDFGELVFRRGLPATGGVILFRAEAESPVEFAKLVVAVIDSRTDWTGHFSVVTRDRIRMSPLVK